MNKIALRPVQQQTRIQCRLIRTIGIMETTFTLNIQNMRDDTERSIMQATKNLLRKDPKYIIKIFTQDGTKNDTILGRVKSNIIGTSFSIYEDDLQSGDVKDSEQVASVDYEPNLLGQRGPRKMSIIIPSMTNEGIRQEIQSDWKHLSLSERVQLGNELRQNLVLCNKPPQWNEETASFVLNFDGRVSMASVKNFQIIHEDDLDYIALQFGRVNDETFTVDIRYPFSLFQAFGIVLTSFDAKIACE
ncbi:tubby C-terminal-like domain-containing protein [Globomyces pollinis-pini]|nr:tubby C-terminal-like domain-containing protein [Globomyces pollinis-pini]